MEDKKPIYETKWSVPQTLGEVLLAICQPFEEGECCWRILSKGGNNGTWVWVRYPVGEFMKRRVAQSCSGGYSTHFREEVINDTLAVEVELTIYDPKDPTVHSMVVQGVGEAELEKDEKKQRTLITADVRKTARTYAFKDAAELLGMGVGEGARAYTRACSNPDGEKTDKWGIPLSEYRNGHMTGGKDSSQVLTDALEVKAWLKVKAELIDTTHMPADALTTSSKGLAATLAEMGFKAGEVVVAAWGEKPEEGWTLPRVIALQHLAQRKNAKKEIQHLLA